MHLGSQGVFLWVVDGNVWKCYAETSPWVFKQSRDFILGSWFLEKGLPETEEGEDRKEIHQQGWKALLLWNKGPQRYTVPASIVLYILGTMKETDLSKLHKFMFFPICTRSQLPPPLPGSTRRPSLKQFLASLTALSQVATTSQQWNHSMVKGMGREHLRVPPSLPGMKPNCIVL